MREHEIFYLTPLKEFAETGKLNWMDGNELWVQQYPFDTWTHPVFSDTTIDVERATKLKESFDKGVRGTKIFADYEHGLDRAKGNKASGTIQELKVITEARGAFTQPGLWARVQFTDTARQEIENGEWNYWSTTHFDSWTHPQTGETHEMVYDGGGVTNKPYVKGMVPLNFSEVGISEEQAQTIVKEEPEVKVEPVVIEDEPVIENEGGEKEVKELEEFQASLREALGLDADADIITSAKSMNDELAPMREALKVHAEKKSFAEQYPNESKRMEELEKNERLRAAKSFAESFKDARLTTKEGDETKSSTNGLSALALEKIEGLAKSFSDGDATIEAFRDVVDSIMNNGIVDYGTKGSTREDEGARVDGDVVPSGNVREVRKAFAEKVTGIMKEDEVEYRVALSLAADKYPLLAEAYHSAGMGE